MYGVFIDLWIFVKGDLFVVIIGENSDGYRFVDYVFFNGVVGVLVF